MVFKEAGYYKKLKDKKVSCRLCPHNCIIENGEDGVCEVRRNVNGKLKSMNYGQVFISTFGKIEDNSVYHFMPGSEVLNVGCLGDNLKCFVQEEVPTFNQTALQVVKQSKDKKVCFVGEPVVYYEYVRDVGERGKGGIFVTKGFAEKEVMKELCEKNDVFVFDIKSMIENFYENICNGKIEPVLDSIKVVHDAGKLVEIKMEIIPEIHKEFYDVRKLVSWILQNLNADVPLHFIAKKDGIYSQEYIDVVKKARKIAMDAGMNYVYVDNLDEDMRTTFCPNCKKPAVTRGSEVVNNLKKGKCQCGKELWGVW